MFVMIVYGNGTSVYVCNDSIQQRDICLCL